MRAFRGLAVVAVLVALAPAARSEERSEDRPASAKPRRQALLVSMNKVIDGLGAKLLAPPSAEGRRVSVKGGLLGVGAYDPRGGTSTPGFVSPPLHVFPTVGLGNSLGVDPNTGRSYWTNMP
jgi:hypothetical protein